MLKSIIKLTFFLILCIVFYMYYSFNFQVNKNTKLKSKVLKVDSKYIKVKQKPQNYYFSDYMIVRNKINSKRILSIGQINLSNFSPVVANIPKYGRIKRVFHKNGDYIKKGAVLYIIDLNTDYKDKLFNNFYLKSPLSGILIRQDIKLDSIVKPSDVLSVISSLDYKLDFNIDNMNIFNNIRVGQRVEIDSSLFSNIDNIYGTVTEVHKKFYCKIGQPNVSVSLNTRDLFDYIGDSVKAYFIYNFKSIMIPVSSIVNIHNDSYVYILKDRKVRRIKIVLGNIYIQDLVMVKSGLKDKDILLLSNINPLLIGKNIKLRNKL